MGDIFSKMGGNIQKLIGGPIGAVVDPVAHFTPVGTVLPGGENDVFDIAGLLQPPEMPEKPVTTTEAPKALPDDDAANAEQQRQLARKFANRGRQGTILSETSNLG